MLAAGSVDAARSVRVDENMKRPLLLDLFCGAGGAAMGYHRAGFDVVGVDIKPQPHYPFEFVQANAMDVPFKMLGKRFDAIHASPPCQAYSAATRHIASDDHPKLIDDLRDKLTRGRLPYVIENVPGAPLKNPVTLCGLSFGLRVKRHRLFELTFPLLVPPCDGHTENYFVIFGHEVRDRRHGHAAGRKNKLADGRVAMGIDWMNRGELSQAIPPAYTEFIGKQLIQQVLLE